MIGSLDSYLESELYPRFREKCLIAYTMLPLKTRICNEREKDPVLCSESTNL